MLGPLTVAGNGALSPRDRVVLSALVVRNGSVTSAEELADALWGDQPPLSWPKVVPGCVNRLRKALGAGAIVTSSNGYRLDLAQGEVDVRRFERLIAKGHQMLALGEPFNRTPPCVIDPLDYERLAATPQERQTGAHAASCRQATRDW